MATAPLASADDVEDVLGRALTSSETSKVTAILAKASADVRRISRRTFSADPRTVRLKVDGGSVVLPEFGVVSLVMDDAGNEITATTTPSTVTVALSSSEFVTVTFTPDATVPDDIRLAVAGCAARILTIDPRAQVGVSQAQQSETTGPFTTSGSSSFAAWAVGGSTILSPDEASIARAYRSRPGHVWVQ